MTKVLKLTNYVGRGTETFFDLVEKEIGGKCQNTFWNLGKAGTLKLNEGFVSTDGLRGFFPGDCNGNCEKFCYGAPKM